VIRIKDRLFKLAISSSRGFVDPVELIRLKIFYQKRISHQKIM
jgi:hypothetical protein